MELLMTLFCAVLLMTSGMPPTSDDFEDSGPVHLRSINWGSLDDQRIVLACLVKATYVLENDIKKKRIGPEALAPAWWHHFNFERREILRDAHDSSIFGCIYELKLPFRADPSAPRFVVAFRGTMLDLEHGLRDCLLDLFVIIGGINKSSRVDTAVKCIGKLISQCTPQNVWVGGHSLGASIATVTCKYMAKSNIHLKTFLFNPPFPSIPFDLLPNLGNLANKLKERLRLCKTTLKVAMSIFKKDYRIKTQEEFSKLSSWIPYLFVNSEDPISASYISYFERREKMKGEITGHIGLVEIVNGKIITRIGKLETRTSLREICSDVIVQGLEMSHLLPSACLAENKKKYNSRRQSHGILQWCRPDISVKFSDYYYQP